MKIKFRNTGTKGYLLAALAALTFSFSASTSAATVTVENGTLTSYDATTGNISFDWDLSSQYQITGTSASVKEFQIIDPLAGLYGTIYDFSIPNFFDPLPLKKIEITMSGKNNTFMPTVLSVIGADSDFYNGGPAVLVEGVQSADSIVEGSTITEFWEIYPNPDYEAIKIFVPSAFSLTTIDIATVSTVPVPAAVWLFASGLIGLVGVARRKA